MLRERKKKMGVWTKKDNKEAIIALSGIRMNDKVDIISGLITQSRMDTHIHF